MHVYRWYFLFVLVLLGSSVRSQDIAQQIRRLTNAQKVQVLSYFRSIGSNLDRELLIGYQQLDQEGQSKALRYIKSLQPGVAGRPDRTTVSWSVDTLNFGVIEEGIIYIDSVKVTNTGSTPYSIVGYQTSCDCAVLQAPTYSLLPGEAAVVRVEFNSLGKAGRVQAGIVLQDNSIPNSRTILYIKGTVSPKQGVKKRPWD
jgi:hypothetical protein